MIETLDWDSEFFGVSVGRVAPATTDLVAAAAEADAKGVDCTYLLLAADDADRLMEAQRAGFTVVDIRIELGAETVSVDDPDHGCRIADPDADASWLKRIASQRFTNSRFFADPHFGREAAGGLFEAWITRGLAGDGRQVVVLDDRAGFVICGRDTSLHEGIIELIATSDSAARGSGLRLMSGAHDWFLAQGLRSASVVTQVANVPALRLYERVGYRARRTDIWLHRWRAPR